MKVMLGVGSGGTLENDISQAFFSLPPGAFPGVFACVWAPTHPRACSTHLERGRWDPNTPQNRTFDCTLPKFTISPMWKIHVGIYVLAPLRPCPATPWCAGAPGLCPHRKSLAIALRGAGQGEKCPQHLVKNVGGAPSCVKSVNYCARSARFRGPNTPPSMPHAPLGGKGGSPHPPPYVI